MVLSRFTTLLASRSNGVWFEAFSVNPDNNALDPSSAIIYSLKLSSILSTLGSRAGSTTGCFPFVSLLSFPRFWFKLPQLSDEFRIEFKANSEQLKSVFISLSNCESECTLKPT